MEGYSSLVQKISSCNRHSPRLLKKTGDGCCRSSLQHSLGFIVTVPFFETESELHLVSPSIYYIMK